MGVTRDETTSVASSQAAINARIFQRWRFKTQRWWANGGAASSGSGSGGAGHWGYASGRTFSIGAGRLRVMRNFFASQRLRVEEKVDSFLVAPDQQPGSRGCAEAGDFFERRYTQPPSFRVRHIKNVVGGERHIR